MTRPQHVAVAGAGLSGAVVARALADAGHEVTVFEGRDHVAGNCHTARDPATGVLVHVYGPHLFHTASARVWDHVRRFEVFRPYRHRVRAVVRGRVYSLPVNLLTINQLFGVALGPTEARALLAERASRSRGGPPGSFEERGRNTLGDELYEAFFDGYTRKQWGMDPGRLPASVFARLPVRFSYDDSYFDHPYQAMPEHGYTGMVERMLDAPAISVHLGRPLAPAEVADFSHTFWTGPLDDFFGGEHGPLPYRTLDFLHEVHDGDYQGCAVMNHCDVDVPHTRVTEHRHLAPWEEHDRTWVTTERSREHRPGDVPYYPVPLLSPPERLAAYVAEARRTPRVTFLGRLGTYRYLDMDRAIDEALDAAAAHLACLAAGRPTPAFIVDVAA